MSETGNDQLASAQEARDVAEAAREAEWEHASFARGLFDGRFELDLVHPFPEPDPADRARAEEFLSELEAFADEAIDGDAIDRSGHVPDEVLDGLARLGAYGIKVPEEYGGLGLSQHAYERAIQIVSSRCGATGAYLSAHQSIGVPQPLILFGTEEQKRKYLPRICEGALSAFALTEPDVGSDPANLSTTAEPAENGEGWILNGEKLWTTNGPRADLLVVMARTPASEKSPHKRSISAFIVETDWPGVETVHECEFMGIRGISNGVLRFTDVRVPAENLLWEEGRGLKLALVTLNTGRLSLPAFCAAAGKAMTNVSRSWAAERVQWGAPIGKHDAIAQKLGRMAADTFAMQAAVDLTALMADSGSADIRIEAAIAKMWHSEKAWEIGNEALQIRGGRGYETARSLAGRGEAPIPVERVVRDLRINLIFEGSSEIMRLFIAREAVDLHLSVAGALVDPRASLGEKIAAMVKAGLHYSWWYPSRWLGWGRWPRYSEFGSLAGHVRYVDRSTRRLARALFHAMVRFGPALEKKQAVLARLVEIGAELFMMTAACSRAHRLARDGATRNESALELADVFCRHAERRIEDRFDALFDNDDAATYRLAQRAMEGRYAWMETDVPTVDAFDRPMVAEAGAAAEDGSPAGAAANAGTTDRRTGRSGAGAAGDRGDEEDEPGGSERPPASDPEATTIPGA